MKRFLFIGILCGMGLSAPAQESKENADFKLAVSLYNDRLYDLALEQFQQFVSAYPNTQQGIEARFYLGLTQAKMGKFEEARFTYQNFALAFPGHPRAAEAWWNSAEAYVQLGNLAEAALAYERVKTFHPKNTRAPAALLKASEYFQRAGDKEKSQRALRSLIQEYASADIIHEARLRLARIYYSDRQYELARMEAKKAADAAPDAPLAPAALLLSAQCLAQAGRTEEAKVVLADVIARYRSKAASFEAILELGKLQKEGGQVEDAVKTWSALLDSKAAPSSVLKEAALLETADALALRESLEKSVDFYQQAAKLEGTRAGEALLKAARISERLGNKQRAGELSLRALKVDDSTHRPDSGSAFRRAILIQAFRGARALKQFQTAVGISQKFLEEFPGDPNVPRLLFETASVYADNLKDYRHAMMLFERILADFGQSRVADDALFWTAQASRRSGFPGEAISLFESLGERFPASDFFEQAQQAVNDVRTYELKDKDGGIENLALLTGDVIAGKSKDELAYRLAEFYFNDRKEYRLAAEQYLAAIHAGLGSERLADAWFKRGRALEYSAGEGSAEVRPVLSSALAAYDSAMVRTSSSTVRGTIMAAKARLSLRTARNVSEVRQGSAELRKGLPDHKGLLELGVRYLELRSYSDARTIFEEILAARPEKDLEARAMYGAAIANIEMAERDSGMATLARFLRKFPDHQLKAKAMARLAAFGAERGDFEGVRELCGSLEQQFPYADAAQGLKRIRGDAFYSAGRYEDALKHYRLYYDEINDDLFEYDVPPTDLVMRLADCSRRSGAYSDARKFYLAGLAKDTASAARAEIYYALAGIAREQNNLEMAAHYLQEASRFGSSAPERQFQASLESADLLFRSEDYSASLARYTELLGNVKGDSLRRVLQSRLVVCYFRLDNLTEAEKKATAFVREYSGAREEAAEFEYERGRYYLRKDEVDQAIRRFENLRQAYPRSPVIPESVYWLARCLEAKNQPQRAIQLYDSLLKTFPRHSIRPRAQLSLGNVYYSLEQWDAAANQYKALVDAADNPPDLVQFATSNLIMAYKEIGLFDAALQLTREYISKYPDDPDLVLKHIDIGVLYQKLGYYDQSILHLQKMLESADPELEGELRYYVGEAFFYKGDYQQAILEFLKVPYLITKRTKIDWVATSYYMAGQSYEKMSKFDQAITMYKQIIERPGIDPTFKSAAQKEIDRVNTLVKAR